MAGKRNKGTGPRPHTWVTGPDPVRHKQYSTWLQCKAQANYRKEGWDLEFKDYVAVWGDSWEQRGRTKNSLQLQRKDHTKPWSKTNVHVVNRTEFRLKQQQIKDQKKAQRDE